MTSSTHRLKTLVAGLLAAIAAAAAAFASVQAAPPGAAAKPPPNPGATLNHVLFVGNNWDGTADVIDPDQGFARIGRINIIPDLQERLAEIAADPERAAFVAAIAVAVGEGHNQYVDDMFSSKEGDLLVVSRPSLRDVVGIDLRSPDQDPSDPDLDPRIVWRFVVDGQRSDHMAMSPDGSRVAVSASTGNVVHILDTYTGQEVGRFPSGDSPHENNYSRDGSKIFHASIGLVYTPADQPQFDSTKGDRRFQIVDTATNQIIEQINMGQKLQQAGHPNMSSAVRPMALSPDEQWLYFQVSFFHGFVEYSFEQDRVTRVAHLPDNHPERPREEYLLDSAHHGLAMNAAGTKLCAAGTMSDYAAIVDRASFDYKLIQRPEGARPYWSTNSEDAKLCFVSWSGLDQISAISYKTAREVARVDVGDHPQRMRTGVVPEGWRFE